MRIIVALSFCWMAVLTLAQDKPVAITAEAHHQLVLENEYTRVFHVIIPPKESTQMHQHDRDYVSVQIGAADFNNARVGAIPSEVKLTNGAVKFGKGGFAHKVTDLASAPFVNVTIEVKKPSTASMCGAAWTGVEPKNPQDCGTTAGSGLVEDTYQLKTDAIEAHSYSMGGSDTVVPKDFESPRLLVALTPLRCVCGNPQALEMNPGDVAWVPKGMLASITKTSTERAEFVMVSFQ